MPVDRVRAEERDIRPLPVARGYERVIQLRDTFCPTVPIVTHCYDYAHPNGIGLLGFSPWIRPALQQVGMPLAMQPDAVRYIIDHYGPAPG